MHSVLTAEESDDTFFSLVIKLEQHARIHA